MFEFILAEKAHYPVRTLCEVLEVSASGYYAWRGRPLISPRIRANRGLRAQIRAIHAQSRQRYGSPRIHAVLQAAGTRIGRKRVIRLMQAEQLRGRPHRRFRVMTTVGDPSAAPAPNRLQQAFRVSAPNRVWTADITALPTGEGWAYLAIVLDLYARCVVGWAVRATLETDLVAAALEMAVGRRRPPPGLVHHSDRGRQYTSERYQRALRAHGMICSMSRPGNCFDNAPTESFFRTLKVELEPGYWSTRTAAGDAVVDFIERFYNTERLHSSLNYLSPVAFERRYAA
jgi:transposase InsO family protein